jgi:hypothetical protein
MKFPKSGEDMRGKQACEDATERTAQRDEQIELGEMLLRRFDANQFAMRDHARNE